MSTTFKTTLIGDSTTGKSSIVKRMKYDTFNYGSECTIGVSFCKLTHNELNYEIWDTAGQERFRALLPMYFRSTRILIFVFDLSSIDTVHDFDRYMKDLIGLENYKIVVVGNKSDLVTENTIKLTETNLKHKFSNLPIADKIHGYVFTSAKTGEGFDNLMEMLDLCAIEIGKTMGNKDVDKRIISNNFIEAIPSSKCYC